MLQQHIDKSSDTENNDSDHDEGETSNYDDDANESEPENVVDVSFGVWVDVLSWLMLLFSTTQPRTDDCTSLSIGF